MSKIAAGAPPQLSVPSLPSAPSWLAVLPQLAASPWLAVPLQLAVEPSIGHLLTDVTVHQVRTIIMFSTGVSLTLNKVRQ